MKDIVVAADLGGTNLRMAAVSFDGDIVKRVKLPTPESGCKEEIVKSICRAAAECTSGLPVEPSALALAVPGTIDNSSGVVMRAPNLPDLDGFNFVDAVRAETKLPVFIENDANAAAIGESWLGASRGYSNSVMVTLGTGVGGGIIIDGKIVRGIDGTAGEIGHINVEPEGLPCGCGSHGCLEQYASASAIARTAQAAFKSNSETQGELDSEDVYQYAADGAEWAREIFSRQGYYLGLALGDLINCLNPEVVVIGGGAAAGWDAFTPTLRQQLEIRAYAEAVARANIVRAELGDNAGILGAAKVAFESLGSVSDAAA